MTEESPPKKPIPPKRVTIRDVAQAAGVSTGAVSAALAGTKSNVGVSRETRERIQRVAQELGYRPHAAARAMAAKSFRTIGVLAAEYCFGSYYTHVLRGLVAQAEALGYHVLLKLVPTRYDLENARIFTEQIIDGVIIPAEAGEHTREALARFQMPHVWLNAGVDEPINCVRPDEVQGLRLAVEHLMKLGHRRIAYMPQEEPLPYHACTTRPQAYLAALAACGLEPVPTHDQPVDIAQHVEQYLAMRSRPTAMIVYSDPIAAWAVNALVKRGVRVPEEMSVVACEGVVWLNYCYRRLTAVRAPVYEMGQVAVRMLVQELETGQAAPSVTLPVSLEVNESTGPPPDGK